MLAAGVTPSLLVTTWASQRAWRAAGGPHTTRSLCSWPVADGAAWAGKMVATMRPALTAPSNNRRDRVTQTPWANRTNFRKGYEANVEPTMARKNYFRRSHGRRWTRLRLA